MRIKLGPAVASLAAAGLVLAGCGVKTNPPLSSSPSQTAAPSPSSTAPPSPSEPPETRATFQVAGPPRGLGPGVAEALSKDGTSVYASADNPASKEIGCEGQAAQYLFAVPLDGSLRRLAAADQKEAIGGNIRRSPDGSKLLITQSCEGFLAALYVATETGAAITGLHKVALPTDGEGAYQNLNAPNWSSDSKTIVAVGSKVGTEALDVVRIDPATGKVTKLIADSKSIEAAELKHAVLVTVRRDKQIVAGGIKFQFDGFGVSVDPSSGKLAVFGESGITLVSTDDGAAGAKFEKLTTEVGHALSWTKSGAGILYFDKDQTLKILFPGRPPVNLQQKAAFGPAFLNPAASRVVYTRAKKDGQFETPEMAILDFKP